MINSLHNGPLSRRLYVFFLYFLFIPSYHNFFLRLTSIFFHKQITITEAQQVLEFLKRTNKLSLDAVNYYLVSIARYFSLPFLSLPLSILSLSLLLRKRNLSHLSAPHFTKAKSKSPSIQQRNPRCHKAGSQIRAFKAQRNFAAISRNTQRRGGDV